MKYNIRVWSSIGDRTARFDAESYDLAELVRAYPAAGGFKIKRNDIDAPCWASFYISGACRDQSSAWREHEGEMSWSGRTTLDDDRQVKFMASSENKGNPPHIRKLLERESGR